MDGNFNNEQNDFVTEEYTEIVAAGTNQYAFISMRHEEVMRTAFPERFHSGRLHQRLIDCFSDVVIEPMRRGMQRRNYSYPKRSDLIIQAVAERM